MQRNITYSSTVEDIEAVQTISKEVEQSKAFVFRALLNLGIKIYDKLKLSDPDYNFTDKDVTAECLEQIYIEMDEQKATYDKDTIIRILNKFDKSTNEKEELELFIKAIEHALEESKKEYERKFVLPQTTTIIQENKIKLII